MSLIRNSYDDAVYSWQWWEEPNPGAGSNIILSALSSARVELVHLSFQFAADASVADRFIRIGVNDGLIDALIGGAEVAITAGQTRRINVGQHGHSSVADGGDTHCIAIPSFPFVLEGMSVYTAIQGLQVGDACTDISVAWKVWVYER